MAGAQASETSSLLNPEATSTPHVDRPPSISSASSTCPTLLPSKPDALRSIVAAFTIHLLLNIATNIALTPQTAILQDIVCKQYYDGVDSLAGTTHVQDKDRCGVVPVQSEVAYVIGWEAAIENIPNMLLAVPFGALADKVGRKRILLVALFGMFMNDAWIRLVYWFPDVFPVRAVWIAGLWQAIGSGAATLSSVTHALVAEACPEEQRTSAFSQIRSAKLLSQLIFVPIGGALISTNPWVPMFVSTGFMISGFTAAVILVPGDWPSEPAHSIERQGLLQDESAGVHSKAQWFSWTGIRSSTSHIADLTASNSRLVPLVLSFFVFQLGEQAGLTLLLQYAAKRLDWTLSKASFLISVRAGVNMSALVVLVPAVSAILLTTYHFSVMQKDKCIAQASGLLLVLGCLVVFQATSAISMVGGLVLISVGDVFAIPVRSLATGLVDSTHLGVLYTVIEVMTQSGLFIGQPMLAETFQWGLKLGRFWIGMPFLFAAAFFTLALIAVSTVPSRRKILVPQEDLAEG
ncbi:Major facilitator superfamily domain, general substrate transporter [Metarhizium brunneum]